MKIKEKTNSFLLHIAENDLWEMLKEMGYGKSKLLEVQRKRAIKFITFLIISIILSYFNLLWFAIGIALTIFQWLSQYRTIQRTYKNFVFKKQFSFFKFSRTLIPYLHQENATVYNVLNRMLKRVDNKNLKEGLERFIIEMNDNPNSPKPFENFGIVSSGTDEAILFMHTLFDFQQHSHDKSIIQELGRMASEDLFKGVDEIIEFKLRKFNMYPTKLTMINLIIIVGFMISTVVNELLKLFSLF